MVERRSSGNGEEVPASGGWISTARLAIVKGGRRFAFDLDLAVGTPVGAGSAMLRRWLLDDGRRRAGGRERLELDGGCA